MKEANIVMMATPPNEEEHNDQRVRRRENITKIAKKNKETRDLLGLDNEGKVEILLKESVFVVEPKEVIFKDVEPGQIYQMFVMVKNLTKYVKRIRVFQPKNSFFRCDYEMLGPIAPGLSMELVISFEGQETGEFRDSITIVSDDSLEFEIPIYAYSPMSKLIFEPFVNFGFIQVGKSKSETIIFKNEGSVEGRIDLRIGELKDLKVEPKGQFTLKKNETKMVTFTYFAREPGIFRGIMDVVCDGKSFVSTIDVNATCVEFLRFIINEEGEELNKIDFGKVLFGEKKKLTGHLINNSPEGFYFNVTYMQGLHMAYKEENDIETPHEQGIQQTRRLLSVKPSSGYIKSYEQIPLVFSSRTFVEEDHKIWTRNYCLANSKEDIVSKNIRQSFQSTAIFFFKKEENDLRSPEEAKCLMMQSEAFCPSIHFSEMTTDFGKCKLGESREKTVLVENHDDTSTLRVECPKASNFTCTPAAFKLEPKGKMQLVVRFTPKNLGKVHVVNDFIVNQKYNLPFTFGGFGKPTDERQEKDSTALVSKSEARLTLPQISQTQTEFLQKSSVDYLKESRKKREMDSKSKLLLRQLSTVEIRTKEVIPKYTQGKGEVVDDWIAQDVKFLFNENKDGLDSPRMHLSKGIDQLFVVKPLGKYEPYDRTNDPDAKFDPNVAQRMLPSIPKTHGVVREIGQTLTNEMLRFIQAGPKIIDFGKVFIMSKTDKYLTIKNDLRYAIRARLLLDQEELDGSDSQQQVIMTAQSASFRVSFLSKRNGDFQKILKYIINEKHIFKFIVKASTTPVDLEISDTKVDLVFNEDNQEMSTFKNVVLKNPGNDVANFDWYSPNSVFRFEPQEGRVDRYSSRKVKIIYTPVGNKLSDEETLDLRIKYGLNKSLIVTGAVSEAKCEVHPATINFGSIAVGEISKPGFFIKNTSNKVNVIFEIVPSSLPSFIKISTLSGRVPPESSLRIELEISSKEEMMNINKSFQIVIRGAKNLSVCYTGNFIIPKVVIHEKVLDFKTVTYGNHSTLPLTIENTSPITTKLNLDLRVFEDQPETEFYNCLKLTQVKTSDNDSQVIEEMELDPEMERKKASEKLEEERNQILNKQKSLDDISLNDDDSNEDKADSIMSDGLDNNCFVITLKPQKLYRFELTFFPKSTRSYEFLLPLTLNGFHEYTDLMRNILCKAVPPKIILDPIDGVRDFKKKTITHLEGGDTGAQTITISNPDTVNSVRFFIDTSSLESSKAFHLSKTEGMIQPKASVEIQIEFTPNVPQVWEFQLPVFVDEDRKNAKANIVLKGESAFPKILFDRREIIMPIVPLGIESKISFYIYNDGYQTVNLKGLFPETFQHFPLVIHFPDGNSLNSRKKRCKVEISFTAKVPMSFTTQLTIEDDQKAFYNIFVSGTAEASFMTNHHYFLRTPKDEYEIVQKDDKPITVKAAEREGSEKSDKGSVAFSKISGSAQNKIGLGYPPIPFDLMERQCRHMARFLSTFVPGVTIANFPADIVNKNGEPLVKIIEYFTKNHLDLKSKISAEMKRVEKISIVLGLYTTVINLLKKEGGMLNNIRPEYLLNWHDLTFHYKKNPAILVHPNGSRPSENTHRYLSHDSWLILFNQILKLFFVNKINASRFKLVPALPEHLKKISPAYETSTVFSPSECILLKWCESSLEKIKEDTRRLNFLNDSFDVGTPLATLFHLYTANSVRPMRFMKEIILNRNEIYDNMKVLKETADSLGLPYSPEISEMVAMDPRELIIYISYLFNVLPNFLPRETLLFECKVDDTIYKNITVTNPLNTIITYYITLEGSEDFSVKQAKIKVEPKTSMELPIYFKGRISKPVTGRISLKPAKEAPVMVIPLVFDLKSKITGRYTLDRLEISDVNLYDGKSKELKIVNPFNRDCEFLVEIEYLPPGQMGQEKKKRAGGYVRPIKDAPTDRIIPSFFCNNDRISLRKNKMVKLKINYIPLTFEIHRCNVILIDEAAGEIQYEVIGIPMYPLPIQSLPIVTNTENSKPHEIMTSLVYKDKQKAYSLAAKLINTVRNDKVRSSLHTFLQGSSEEQTFKVESTALKEISVPQTLTIQSLKKLDSTNSLSQQSSNSFLVNLNLRQPVKDYNILIILKNADLTDVRVIELIITILPKVFKAALDFITPVKIPIEQKIPVSNPSQQEVIFNVLKEDVRQGEYFNCSKNLKVKGDSTEDLAVVFNPIWIGNAATVIKIQNPHTREEFHYSLTGTGQEPLAENHYKCRCNVGEEEKLVISVANDEGVQREFKVNVEIYGVSCAKSVKVDAYKTVSLPLAVKPVLGGVYAGCITLTDQFRKYMWYTFEMEYQGKKNVRNLEFVGLLRKENRLEIEVDNPSDERIEFKVFIKGEGLSGDDNITVGPRETNKYPLFYLPLRIMDSDATVIFSNSKIGELLCKINIKSKEPTPDQAESHQMRSGQERREVH
jgi:hypothetical protein